MKSKLSKGVLKFKHAYSKYILHASRITFWFLVGSTLSFIFVSSFGFFAYQKIYQNKIYPGVYVNDINFGGKTQQNVKDFFSYKNYLVKDTSFVFESNYGIATVSAKQINFGYDENLAADQAYSIGRSGNIISDVSLIIQSYTNGIHLPVTYTYNQDALTALIKPLSLHIEKNPVDAVFKFENSRVTTFTPSSNGQEINMDLLNTKLLEDAPNITSLQKPEVVIISIPIKIIEPNISTDKANKLGIKELIGEGHSLFFHSIPSRIYNINLAATRVNGVLIAPGETFSFDKALGDVSSFTGYQQAYVIQNGKTVLGDGGGVCQVSTTFFRALLNAGLSITERHAHAYRVGYYEEDSPPGLDATIFVPTVDLKFKNDTGHHILVQSQVDLDNLSLAFYLYGTKDGRQITIGSPVVSNIRPAPADVYQDDPTFPKGQVKQTDFAASGADVYVTRTVTKNEKTIISDKFVSNYQPWQAIYLRGTKE